MGTCRTYELSASKAYVRVQQNSNGGYDISLADLHQFSQAQGVGRRLEPELTPLPSEVSETSAAISLKAIADELQTIRRVMIAREKREREAG